MAKKQKQMPEILFICREGVGTEFETLRCETNIKNLADLIEDKIVGVYKLTDTKTLTTVVKWKDNE